MENVETSFATAVENVGSKKLVDDLNLPNRKNNNNEEYIQI